MRHLTALFEELDLAYDQAGRRQVDRALRALLPVSPDAHCPEIWAAVKSLPAERRERLADEVRPLLAASVGRQPPDPRRQRPEVG